MVAIGYRLSIMNLVTSFLCDILLAHGVQEIQGMWRGKGGRPESLTDCDLTVFSMVWNANYRKSLQAISTSLFNPHAVCSPIVKAFSSWYRNIPAILSLESSEYALFQSSSLQTPLLQLDL